MKLLAPSFAPTRGTVLGALWALVCTTACTASLDFADGALCTGPGQCLNDTRCVLGVCVHSDPTCGDFEVGGNEACDDGNSDDTDACTSLCALPTCGDGFHQAASEECDDGNTEDGDTCAANCTICGNDHVQAGIEACDGPVANGSCTLACELSCNAPYDDCDDDGGTGCETNTQTSALHCSACNEPCSTTGGTPTCAAGVCSIVCDATHGDCNTSASDGCETNLDIDVDHCGACGRQCPAGCEAGACVGEVVVAEGRHMAIFGGDVYWSLDVGADDARIRRRALSGGATTDLVSDEETIDDFAADADGVYWMNFHTVSFDPVCGVKRVVPPSTTPTTFYGGAFDCQLSKIKLTPSHIFFGSREGSGALMRSAKPAGSASGISPAGGAYSLVVGGGRVYWAAQDIVYSQPVGGGTILQHDDAGGSLVEMGIDSTELFWSATTGGATHSIIRRMPLGGGTVTEVVSGQSGVRAIASDDNDIYWATNYEIRRVAKSGGPVRLAAVKPVGTPTVVDLVIDGDHLYWSGGGIWRVPR